jgi:hypothetical protein
MLMVVPFRPLRVSSISALRSMTVPKTISALSGLHRVNWPLLQPAVDSSPGNNRIFHLIFPE